MAGVRKAPMVGDLADLARCERGAFEVPAAHRQTAGADMGGHRHTGFFEKLVDVALGHAEPARQRGHAERWVRQVGLDVALHLFERQLPQAQRRLIAQTQGQQVQRGFEHGVPVRGRQLAQALHQRTEVIHEQSADAVPAVHRAADKVSDSRYAAQQLRFGHQQRHLAQAVAGREGHGPGAVPHGEHAFGEAHLAVIAEAQRLRTLGDHHDGEVSLVVVSDLCAGARATHACRRSAVRQSQAVDPVLVHMGWKTLASDLRYVPAQVRIDDHLAPGVELATRRQGFSGPNLGENVLGLWRGAHGFAAS